MRRLAVLVVLGAAGCTLVDQNTFNPNAGAAPVIPAAAKVVAVVAPPGPPPLLTIAPSAGAEVYGAVLRKAVADATARKPTVVFDVVEMQPPDLAVDAPMGVEAAAVARMIVAQGVLPGRVRLVARPDAGAVAREVRVYVR